ncbi:MAG: DNA recombination protein RmuC, partial [Fimbriimonadaceae bacterium]
ALAFCVLLWQTVRRQTAEMASARGEREQAAKELSDLRTEKAKVDTELAGIKDSHAKEIATLAENHKAQLSQQAANALEQLKINQESHQKLLDAEKSKHDALQKELARQREEFDEQMKNFLQARTGELIKVALEELEERAEKEFENKSEKIDKLFEPMNKGLEDLRKKAEEYDKAVRDMGAGLKENIVRMTASADRLSNALIRPHVRGSWGETQLQIALETAGFDEGIHYKLQVSTQADEDRLRPDVVLNLPSNRKLVIDAKLSLDAYNEAVNEKDADRRNDHFQRHARSVKAHIDQLSRKDYRRAIEGFDFVIMFVPMESMYFAAMEHEPELMKYALERNVMLANPMTLMTILLSVAHLYRLVQANEESAKIHLLAVELCERLGTFSSHFEKVGKHLKSAVQSYNEGVRSYQSRLYVTAGRIRELGISSRREITLPDEVDTTIEPFSHELVLKEMKEAREVDELPEPQEPGGEMPEALLEE